MATFPASWTRRADDNALATTKPGPDREIWWLACAAAVASIAALVYFYRRGVLLSYSDTVAHMTIARQVVDNSSGSLAFGQLGAVWLPLPHLLAMPFVWNDDLFYTGLAGTFESMASYVVLGVYLYKIVRDLTGRRSAAIAATLVMLANANVLYMQSVPMTEMLLFACTAATVYYLQRWIRTDRWGSLAAAGVAANLGCATRYEAWVVLIGALLVIALVLAVRRESFARFQDVVLGFALFGFFSIGLWLLWNQLIFGNALTFQTGDYAKPSNWVTSSDVAVGNLAISAKTYWYAILDNAGLPVVLVGAAGLVAALVVKRTRLVVLPTVSILLLVPFFVLSLYKGQRPLHVLQENADLYNVRFGLLILFPLAVGVGCLIGALPRPRWRAAAAALAVVAVVGTSAAQFAGNDIVLAKEPSAWLNGAQSQRFHAVSAFLKAHYEPRGGRVLAAFFGNEDVLFGARISPGNNVNEGSFKVWEKGLANPLDVHATWIVMREGDAKDQVWAHLHASPVVRDSYHLVYRHMGYRVYERDSNQTP